MIGVSKLTLYESFTTVRDPTGSEGEAKKAAADLRLIVAEIVPVSDEIVEIAMELRNAATARIALADCLIAATAAHRGAILVH